MRFLKAMLAAFIFFMLPIAIHAEGYIDENKKGSVRIDFSEADTEFHFYKVASVNGNGTIRMKTQYLDTNVYLQNPQEWERDASTLAAAIQAHNAKKAVGEGNKLAEITPDFTITTTNGTGSRGDIPVGVYLVTGDARKVGNVIYYPTPFLLSMPSTGTDPDNIDINYDIVIDNVKHTEKPVEDVYYKVVKHWKVPPKTEIPKEIEVVILHGDEMVDPNEIPGFDNKKNKVTEDYTVLLGDYNNWEFSWGPVMLDTEPWSVWEFMPAGSRFHTTVESSEDKNLQNETEVTFTITNTTYLTPSGTPEESDTPTPTPTTTPTTTPTPTSSITPTPKSSHTPTPRVTPTPTPRTTPTPTPGTKVPPGIPNTSDRNNVMWSIIGLCASGMIALVSGIIVLKNND